MIPVYLIARFAFVLVLTLPIGDAGLPQASPIAAPNGTLGYATAILEGLGGTGGARDINAGGDIVGYVTEPDSEVELPALWQDGALELLQTLDGPGGAATAINDRGDIAGYLEAPEGDPRPVVWRDGVPTVLETPSGVGYANAINNAGQVVGLVRDVDGRWQPALWESGRLAMLDTGDAPEGLASDINDAGLIVGTIRESDQGRAVMWDRGERRVLGPLGSVAWRVSAAGVVVGTAPDPGGAVNADGEVVSRAVTWRDREMAWVDVGEGITDTLGTAIDDRGGVVISVSSDSHPTQAVLMTADGPVSLEGLSDMSKPEAVDAYSVVVGSAFFDDGDQPVRWIPVHDLTALPATSDVAEPWAMLALPSLGGDTHAYDINLSGTVAGSVEHASSGIQRPAMWRDGELIVLDGIDGHDSAAMAINDGGVAVGFANTADGDSRPVRWDGRKPTDLGTLGGPEGFANAINNAGQIAGWAETPDEVRHAVVWDDGEIVDLGTMGDAESVAIDINDAGQILVLSGSSIPQATRSALWENGVPRSLTPSSIDFFWASAVNARGEVVGFTFSPNGQPVGIVLEDGRWREISAPAGQSWWPTGVNDDGTVVGEATRLDSEDDWSAAVLWRDGVEVSMVPETLDLPSTAADINDRGIVAGEIRIAGDERAVIWIPVAGLLPNRE